MISLRFLLIASIIGVDQSFANTGTVCQHILAKNKDVRIQGFAYLKAKDRHVLFYDDKVYEFTFNRQASRPSVDIVTGGVKLDKYFPGTHLLNGATILYAYGLSNDTTKIFITVTRKDFSAYNSESESPEDMADIVENLRGFIYDTSVNQAYEFENSQLPYDFPYVFFSNNQDKVYLQQFHQYSFFPMNYHNAEGSLKDFNLMTYFAANQYEYKLTQVNLDLREHPSSHKKYLEIFRQKMKLKAAFGFDNFLYFLTDDYVYYLEEQYFDLKLYPDGDHKYAVKKMPLSEFFNCTEDAVFALPDYGDLVLGLLWLVFILLACCVCCYPLRFLCDYK